MTAAELIAADPQWFAELVAAMAPPALYSYDGQRWAVTR